MTGSIVGMSIIGVVLIIASFLISERFTKKESNFNIDLLTVNDDYQFSEREQSIIKRKIEDVIARQAKDILYETNDSLANMANEKMMAFGDYAVAVCDEIEKNHKEVMFLYSMLDDKQKEIMNTVKAVDEVNRNAGAICDQLDEKIQRLSEKTRELQESEQKANSEKTKDSKRVKSTEEPGNAKKSQSAKSSQKTQEARKSKKEEERTAQLRHSRQITSGKVEEKEMDLEIQSMFAELEHAELRRDERDSLDGNENSRDAILEMYQKGNSIIDIAKQLGLGVGEVKLVIDLYQGD